MNGVRIGVTSIVLLVLLMSISAVNCQNASSQNVSDQKITDNLNNIRLRLLTVLDATIPVKDHFNKTGSIQSSTDKGAVKISTYKDKNGRILTEMTDNKNELLNDTFQDPGTNLVLNTEYAAYKEPLCYTLLDATKQEQLKVCYRCNDSHVWQNQTAWDLKTGNMLIVKVNCCSNTTQSTLQKISGLPIATIYANVSAVNYQNASNQNVSDQKIIDNLDNIRLRLLTVLDATIPVKNHFNKTGSVQNSVDNVAGKITTYKEKNGRVLVEMMDNKSELLNDTFQDPGTNLVLNTEYAAYKEPLCCTLLDTKKQEQIKVCYRCNVSHIWQNQTAWDLKTGNMLIVKVNCCGNITESALQRIPGLPPGATFCTVTGQFEVPQ